MCLIENNSFIVLKLLDIIMHMQDLWDEKLLIYLMLSENLLKLFYSEKSTYKIKLLFYELIIFFKAFMRCHLALSSYPITLV